MNVVLVVEDEALIRMLLVEELEGAGFCVIEAENADAAMAILSNRSDIAFVLTDIRMPGSIDGVGLASWMREQTPSVRIIVTSGFATPPDFNAINPAIARIVAKPYRPQDAANWLRDLGCSPVN